MPRFIKIILPIGVILLLIPILPMLTDTAPGTNITYVGDNTEDAQVTDNAIPNADRIIQNAFDSRQSKLQVQGKATVYKILPDDLKGSRHQKFLLRLKTGLSLLVAHNIDLAPRINGLNVGDTVEFYGVYEWNEKGGVIHWTHHDPDRRHKGGWLVHNGLTYE